jgi:flagellar biosynthesis activator protein FlaF
MYRQFYDEVAQESAATGRAAERRAFEHLISLLERAKIKGVSSREAVEALHFLNKLWTMLLEDLASPGNALPADLRARLISIGIWIMKQAQLLRVGAAKDFQSLIDITRSVATGLGVR